MLQAVYTGSGFGDASSCGSQTISNITPQVLANLVQILQSSGFTVTVSGNNYSVSSANASMHGVVISGVYDGSQTLTLTLSGGDGAVSTAAFLPGGCNSQIWPAVSNALQPAMQQATAMASQAQGPTQTSSTLTQVQISACGSDPNCTVPLDDNGNAISAATCQGVTTDPNLSSSPCYQGTQSASVPSIGPSAVAAASSVGLFSSPTAKYLAIGGAALLGIGAIALILSNRRK
jgi:hypothetical protein